MDRSRYSLCLPHLHADGSEIHLEHHRHLKSVSLESRVRSLILEVGWRARMVLHKSYCFDIILSRN